MLASCSYITGQRRIGANWPSGIRSIHVERPARCSLSVSPNDGGGRTAPDANVPSLGSMEAARTLFTGQRQGIAPSHVLPLVKQLSGLWRDSSQVKDVVKTASRRELLQPRSPMPRPYIMHAPEHAPHCPQRTSAVPLVNPVLP